MTRHRLIRRARPSLWFWLAVLVSALAAAPSAGAAQVRPDTIPRDTVPGDTIPQDTIPGDTLPRDPLVVPIPPEQVAQDTLPPDSALVSVPDSLRPAPRLPEAAEPFPVGFGYARWEWDRGELLRFHGLSLLELLEQIPGLVVTRSGGFGRPAGLGFLGGGGGAVRVFRDGFEVDPLTSAVLDLQHIGLVDLQSVRVLRRPGEIRVDLSTFQLEDSRALSLVEAGTGNFEAKLLRALFARVVGSRSTVTGAFDLTSTNGFSRDEPFSFSSGRLRWTYALSERAGLQAEYRRAGIQREPRLERFAEDSLYLEDSDRTELVLRGRYEPFAGLTLDGLVARTTRSPSELETEGDPPSDRFAVDFASTQASLRAGYALGPGFAEVGARLRQGDAAGRLLPSADLTARAFVRPLPWIGLEGEARSARMEEGQATRLSATARSGLLLGFSAFATVSAGERWAASVRDTLDVQLREDSVMIGGESQPAADSVLVPLYAADRVDAGGLRAGVEWTGRGIVLGAAYLSSQPTLFAPYGLAFDRGVAPLPVGGASGVEAYGSIPVPFFWPGVRLQGWYVNWLETGNQPYLPLEQAKLGIEFHETFVDGEFEPTLRIEALYRGGSLAPALDRTAFDQGAEAYTLANLFLQIRIMDLRAFLVFENFLNAQGVADIPGIPLAGPRTVYGIRWHFRN